MMGIKIVCDSEPNQRDIDVLGEGINSYAKQKKALNSTDTFAFFIRDDAGKIFGGCNGILFYGAIYIDQLWIDETIRNEGWGTQLMQAALAYGKSHACTFATLSTMDWEALGFYQKLGFEIEFERHGFQKQSVQYFLRKAL